MHTKDGHGPVDDRASSILQKNVLRHMRQGTKNMGGRLISGHKTPAEIPSGPSSGQCPQAVLFVISLNVYAPCAPSAIIITSTSLSPRTIEKVILL